MCAQDFLLLQLQALSVLTLACITFGSLLLLLRTAPIPSHTERRLPSGLGKFVTEEYLKVVNLKKKRLDISYYCSELWNSCRAMILCVTIYQCNCMHSKLNASRSNCVKNCCCDLYEETRVQVDMLKGCIYRKVCMCERSLVLPAFISYLNTEESLAKGK